MCTLAEVEQIQSIGSISPLKKTPSCNEGPIGYLMLDFAVKNVVRITRTTSCPICPVPLFVCVSLSSI